MNGLDLLFGSLKTWMDTIGRPVGLINLPPGSDPGFLPALAIDLVGRVGAETEAMSGPVARWVTVSFVSVGRSSVDALWLDAKVMALLTGPLPTGLSVDICYLHPDPGVALSSVDGGRMLATHRAALAYR